MLTADLQCCASEVLDRCGVCDGDETGCLWVGTVAFATPDTFGLADVERACSTLKLTLISAGFTAGQIAAATCGVNDTSTSADGGVGSGNGSALEDAVTGLTVLRLRFPMAAAAPKVLAALQLLSPRALATPLRLHFRSTFVLFLIWKFLVLDQVDWHAIQHLWGAPASFFSAWQSAAYNYLLYYFTCPLSYHWHFAFEFHIYSWIV